MKKIFAATLLLFGIFFATTASAESWRYATINHSGTWYIDAHSVMLEKNSDGEFIFFTLVKQELSAAARKQYGRENVHYKIFREEFKLSEGIKYFRVGATTNYNFDGSSYSNPIDTFDWDIISAGSVAELLYETTYRFLQLQLDDVE